MLIVDRRRHRPAPERKAAMGAGIGRKALFLAFADGGDFAVELKFRSCEHGVRRVGESERRMRMHTGSTSQASPATGAAPVLGSAPSPA